MGQHKIFKAFLTKFIAIMEIFHFVVSNFSSYFWKNHTLSKSCNQTTPITVKETVGGDSGGDGVALKMKSFITMTMCTFKGLCCQMQFKFISFAEVFVTISTRNTSWVFTYSACIFKCFFVLNSRSHSLHLKSFFNYINLVNWVNSSNLVEFSTTFFTKPFIFSWLFELTIMAIFC